MAAQPLETATLNDEAIALLDPAPGEAVLDLGCGPGRSVAEIAGRGARVSGIDPSPVMISQARRRNRAAVASGQVQLHTGDESLPAPNATIDLVDYSDAASLRRAFAGAERVLLVSGSEVGNRVDGHRNAISAAAEAGVGLLAYTSIANAGTSSIMLAADHQATERALRDSGVPFVVLRSSWYLENYTGQLPAYLQHGAVSGSAGDGRVSAAARADHAAAAAAVLTTDGHEGKTYELGGDAFTLADLAAAITDATGTAVTYVDLPEAEYTDLLVAAGLPAAYAAALADSDRGIARGDLLVAGTALSDLIGRPTTSLAEAVAKAADSLTVS